MPVQTYQLMLDRWTPYTTSRWVATVLLLCAFMGRILLAQVRSPCFSLLVKLGCGIFTLFS